MSERYEHITRSSEISYSEHCRIAAGELSVRIALHSQEAADQSDAHIARRDSTEEA